MRKIPFLIIVCITVLCTGFRNNDVNGENQLKERTEEIGVLLQSPTATGQPEIEMLQNAVTARLSTDVGSTNEKTSASASVFHKGEWLVPIIDAYVTYVLSDYTVYDESLLGTGLWPRIYPETYNFGIVSDERPFVYALYDINNDGIQELIIGVKVYDYYGISGIYALRNGEPTSVIQVNARYYLHLLLDDMGNVVVSHTCGRMSASWEYYYSLDNNADLNTLNILYTSGHIIDYELGELIGFERGKDVNGEFVNITEEEYLYWLSKYGAGGYSSSIKLDEERHVSLQWSPILINNDIFKVEVNNAFVTFPDQQPIIVSDNALIPIRGVFEALGYTVEWNPDLRQVTMQNDDYVVCVTENAKEFSVNGEYYELETHAQILTGRLMLPVRTVLESVGCIAVWDGSRNTVTVSSYED